MPLGEEQAIPKRTVKNTPVPNEFKDSEKITIEEVPSHQNLPAHTKPKGPCSGITLRAKALRVMSHIKGEAPFQVLSPRQGRPKSQNRLERALFRKFWCMHPNFGAIIRNENTLSWTSRMDHRTRLDLK